MSAVLPSRSLAALLVLSSALFGCSDPPPVAKVSAEPKSVAIAHGECATVKTTWEMLAPLDDLKGSPTVFVHLYHRDRRAQRTFDHPLPFAWKPGSRGEDVFTVCNSALATRIVPDPYVLRAGLYDNGSGERWPLQIDGEQLARNAYALVDVTVPLEAMPARYDFSGVWSEAKTSSDLQHPTVRLLSGAGTVSVADAPSPSDLVARVDAGPSGAVIDARPYPPGIHLIRIPLTNGGATLHLQPRSAQLALLELGIERAKR